MMLRTIAVFVLVALLAGCGGSSSPSPAAPTVRAPPTLPATTGGSSQATATGAAPVSPLPTATAPGAMSPLPTATVAGAANPLATGAAAAQPVIHVTRSGGFAGKTEEWSAYADGLVVSSSGAEHTVAPGEVERFAQALASSGLFGAQGPSGLGPGSCRDCYNYEITVTSGGRTQTVHFTENPGALPSGVEDSLAQLNKLLNARP